MLFDDKIAMEVAAELLKIGAVKLSPEKPFIWASGWHSPIYCDNRISLSYPDSRNQIKNNFAELIQTNFSNADSIAAVATAGIAHGALIADHLQLPFSYVRSSPKEHGMKNLVEGRIESGQKVVVVEDLISTGGSSLKVVDALRDAGAIVIGLIAIFSYSFPDAEKKFEEYHIPLFTLTDYPTLLNMALQCGAISSEQIATLNEWRLNPASWNQTKITN